MALVIGGIILIAGSGAAGLGPIALVCGVLMVWSGIVKAIVLRIWHTTLNADSAPNCTRPEIDSGTAIGQRS
jgi:hypothetical protein